MVTMKDIQGIREDLKKQKPAVRRTAIPPLFTLLAWGEG